jgi:epoxyqueuosine reductase
MTRDPHARANPASAAPHARSVLTVGVSYYQGALPPKPGAGFGRVARYAWGEDYHPLILSRLEALAARLPDVLGQPVSSYPAVDTRPLLERALARSAGLGFTGKNTVTIVPRSGAAGRFHVGSFIFLGEILLDIESDAPVERPADGCGSCRRCLDVCPTRAFDGPYRLNAGRCISYLTIENKGPIARELRAAVGDWIFGCDLCQDVCPFNARAFDTRWPELRAERGAGAWLGLDDVLRLDAAAFKARFAETPLARSKRRGLLRNACVVAGNSGDERLAPSLEDLTADREPLARGHALWALARLSPARARRRADALLRDDDAGVRDEARFVLEGAA